MAVDLEHRFVRDILGDLTEEERKSMRAKYIARLSNYNGGSGFYEVERELDRMITSEGRT